MTRQQKAEQRAIERELAEIAAMPNVRILDRMPHGEIHRFIPSNNQPWPKESA